MAYGEEGAGIAGKNTEEALGLYVYVALRAWRLGQHSMSLLWSRMLKYSNGLGGKHAGTYVVYTGLCNQIARTILNRRAGENM